MQYFVAEDDYYYSPRGTAELLEQYKNIDKIINISFMPYENISEHFGDTPRSRIALLAPFLPDKLRESFSDTLYFDRIYLPNRFGILTTNQKLLNISETEVLEIKYGVKFYHPHQTLADYGGAGALHEYVSLISRKHRYNLKTKGFLVIGMPGTGKSLFAKVVAGELGYVLVSVNLSMFMEKEDSIYSLQQFFSFFENNPGNYVLWIDEIEKSFTGGEKSVQLMGQLLTSINEVNEVSVSNFFLVATANNIGGLAKRNPEFFRPGRFDQVLFLLNPKEGDAAGIFQLYIDKAIKLYRSEPLPAAAFDYADDVYYPDSKISELGKMLVEYMVAEREITIEGIIKLGRDKFIEFCNTDLGVIEKIIELDEIDPLLFDVSEFIRFSTSRYREASSQKERYVYTPAEIEHIVNDCFATHYLFSGKQPDYLKIAKSIRPLQVNIKDSIREMLSHASNFREV